MTELNAKQLAEQAREQTPLSDFGDDTWEEGLARLVDALQTEARLSELGQAVVVGELTGYLGDRLQIVADRRAHPERGAVDVVPPVVIVGRGRPGTTILHDLLAQDPAHRVPLTWEVDRPCPPPETATYGADPRIAPSQAQCDPSELLIPGFLAIHPMGAQLAQECIRITAAEFRSLIFPTVYRAP